MKSKPSVVVAIAILISGLLIGGTGGAIAAGKIGTGQLKNNAVTSPKIKNKTVKTMDLAPSARGAKVIQYIADGAVFNGADTTAVDLPGTWNVAKLANSTWSVTLVRNGPPSYLFPLGQAANAGESSANGFYIFVNGGTATVLINGSSYGSIDEIRINRTISTAQNSNTTMTPRRLPRAGAGG